MNCFEEKFKELVMECQKLGNDNANQVLKCLVVYKLGVNLEFIFAEENTKDSLKESISNEVDNLKKFITAGVFLNNLPDKNLRELGSTAESIEDETQSLYGNLWVDFDFNTYFGEAFARLESRLTKNNIDTSWFKDKVGLDAGCGGGRYTVALAKLGFKKMYGVDLSKKGIPDAISRIKGTEFENKVEFINSNVLDLPFEDNTFDFVFSNGVLHHTVDPIKGIRECYRVLKPGGKIWLYMWWKDGIINNYWDSSREILKGINPRVMQNLLITLNLPPNRRFYFMDPWFVPIRKTYSSKELENIVSQIGFSDIKRLERGYDTDTNEMSFLLGDIGKVMYGEGDLRYLAEK